MLLEKVISLANQNTKLRFLAMERSLRATGCDLPLLVIPYDDKKFELPKGAEWWEDQNVFNWLAQHEGSGVLRKYQCLLENNYQFVDSDVIFLKNPETVLQPFAGFITSCGHWHNPFHTTTPESLNFFNKSTTTWQQKIFNSGQFACERIIYDFDELKNLAEQYNATCFDFRYHEQPGLNLLVNLSGIPITNITLQPHYMESTWAGDYTDNNYERFWKVENHKPYIIHWAGCDMNINRPVNKLFFEFLTNKEKREWHEKVLNMQAKQNTIEKKIKKQFRKFKAAIKLLSE